MNYRFRAKWVEPEPDNDEVAYTHLSYDIGKYFFEVVRNILVVGAIKFFADKTGHWALHTLFYLSLGAFLFLFQSFFFSWRLRIFTHYMGEAGRAPDRLVTFLFTAACIWSAWYLVFVIASQIAAVTR